MYKLSIVTPSFNSEKYIEDCIRSVLDQNYSNIEHIIIDGGSTDNTIAILKKYPHLKWISERDNGQSQALNKGFKIATGEIIGWLNADECYRKGTFEVVNDYFGKNQSKDVLFGDNIFVNEDGKLIRLRSSHTFTFNTLLFYGCFIPTVASFFRRRIIEQNFLLKENLHYAMDYEYYLRLANNNMKFGYDKRIAGIFRWHSENKSNDNIKRAEEVLKIKRSYSKIENAEILKLLSKIFKIVHFSQKVINGNIFREISSKLYKDKPMIQGERNFQC